MHVATTSNVNDGRHTLVTFQDEHQGYWSFVVDHARERLDVYMGTVTVEQIKLDGLVAPGQNRCTWIGGMHTSVPVLDVAEIVGFHLSWLSAELIADGGSLRTGHTIGSLAETLDLPATDVATMAHQVASSNSLVDVYGRDLRGPIVEAPDGARVSTGVVLLRGAVREIRLMAQALKVGVTGEGDGAQD